MLEHFIKYLPVYKVIMAETDIVFVEDNDTQKNLFDSRLISQIEEKLEMTSQLFKIIGADESIKLGEATELWLNLRSNISKHDELFEQYKYQFLDKHSASAYYFNPFADRKLLEDWIGKIQIFTIGLLSADGTKSFSKYRRLDGKFNLFKTKTVDVETYWDLLRADHKDLSEVAMKLINLPSSAPYSAHCLLSEKHENRGSEFTEQCMTLSYHPHYNDRNKNV